MTDRAYEPANPDPFAAFNPQAENVNYEPGPQPPAPKPVAPQAPADPFANFDTQAKKVTYQTEEDATSATGSFLRSAARSVLPAVGSFPAMGAGAEIGAALGSPGGPVGMAVGGAAGALIAGIGSSMLISHGQDYALSKMPDAWVEGIGQDDAQRKLDEQQHSKASFLGGLLPYLLTMYPGSTPLMTRPENATAFQRIMSNPTVSRVFGGGLQGGMELGNEALSENPVEWSKVAIATGFGVVWNRPTRIGERLTEVGAQPARRVLGRPEPTPATAEPAPGETAPAPAPESAVPVGEAIPAEAAEPKPVRYGVDLFTPPAEERPITVADAADLGVMGPGVTKSTFEGAHERDPSAVQTARDAKRTEQSVIGPDPQADVHHTAERMHPELFEHYADLKDQQRSLQDWFATHEGEIPPNPAHLVALAKELNEIEPQIAAAYRRAAEAAGTHVVEPDVAANAEASKVKGPEKYVVTDPLGAKTDGETLGVQVLRDKEGKTSGLLTDHGVTEVSPAYRDLPAEQAIAHTFGDHPPDAPPDVSKVQPAVAVRTIEQQRDYIRDDVAKQLVAAGRPAEEAQAAAALIAARYETRAAAFGGKRGTAEELYNADAAEILGPGARSQQSKGQPRAAPKYEKLSALQFIASRGGIKADDPLVADVQSIFGAKNKFVPGFGQLIRKNGLPLDQMREAMAEAGYFPAHGTTAEAMAGTKVNHLLDVLAAESKGRRELKPGEELPAEGQRDDHLNAIEQEIDAGLKEVGIDPASLSDNVRARTLEIMDKEGVRDPVAAYEKAESELGLFQKQQAEPFYSGLAKAIEDIPQDKAHASQWLGPRTERSYIAKDKKTGKETPVTEVSYSGIIGNRPGVKPEELEWLGLDTWLKEQKGQVTKQQIADYVRANQIEVKEVMKGDRPPLEWKQDEHGNWLAPDGKWIKEETRNGEQAFITYNASNRAISRTDTLAQAKHNIEEAHANEPSNAATRFDKWTLPGGENYRELMLTLPKAERDTTRPDAEAIAKHSPEWDRIKAEIEPFNKRIEAGDHTAMDEISRLHSEFGKVHDKMMDETMERLPPHRKGESYRVPSSHAYGEDAADLNRIGHIRFNDRVIDGKKTLFIEEGQSDMHQRGRKQGYKKGNQIADRQKEIERQLDAMKDKAPDDIRGSAVQSSEWAEKNIPEYKTLRDELFENQKAEAAERRAVPDAPFKTTWPELMLKRMIRYAAENGYEKLAWTPGHVQAERYDLSKHVNEIEYIKNSDGTYKLGVTGKNGEGIELPNSDKMTLADIESTVGKEIAEKIAKEEGKKYRGHEGHTLDGLDLKVGGEGMEGFYDKMWPAAANKLVKKFGEKVSMEEMPLHDLTSFYIHEVDGSKWRIMDRAQNELIGPEFKSVAEAERYLKENTDSRSSVNVHTLDINPEISAAATEQGFSLFQETLNGKPVNGTMRGKIIFNEQLRPIIRLTKDANASTFIHETGHEWLEQMMKDASHSLATDQLRTDATIIDKWLDLTPGEQIPVKAHEKFARGFEQYLREGVAPSPQLATVFAKFRQWLVQIYQTLKGLGQPISEDIRGVFDRMLAGEPQRTVIAPEKLSPPSRAEVHEADAVHAAPHEAEAHRDRIVAESNDHYNALPEDIRREHEAAIAETAKLEAEGVQPGATADVAGEAGAGQPERGEVVGAGNEPELEPTGGAGGAEHGAERQGGAATERQGADVSGTAQRPGGGEKSESVPLAPTPAANFSVTDQTKWISKEGNIRVENITSVPEFKAAIDEAAQRTGQQGQGTVTMGEMLDLAEISGIDPIKVTETQLASMFGGVQGLASKVWALRTAVKDSAQIVSNAMRAVRDDASDANAAAFALAISRHDMLQSTLSGVTAEVGRGLGMGFRKMEGWEKAKDLNQFMKENTGRTLFQLKQMAKLGSVLDTPAQVSKFVADAQKRTFGKMVLEYWINGLLSGPATHSTNTIGNMILTLQHAVPETAAAAAIGRIRTMLGREGETVRIGEIGARLKGLTQSLPSALQATAESFRASTTVLLPGEEARPLPYQTHADLAPHPPMQEGMTYNNLMTNAFGAVQGLRDATVAMGQLIKAGGVEGAPTVGAQYALTGSIPDIQIKGVTALPLGTIARLPGRFLSAADSFFRVANYSMAKNAIAYRTASEEGHVGTAFDARVAEIRDNPTEAMMTKMVEEATELTLQAKGGKLLQALQHLAGVEIGGFPVMKFITPFVHVAGNIMKQTLVQRTPFGMFSPEIRADLAGKNGNIAADMAMARMVFGTTLAVTFGTLAAQGYASGSGPTDPNEAAMWRLAGNQAHSVRIGDMWYGVQKLGPLGLLMGLSADLYDVAHSASEGEMTEAAAHLVHAVSQNVLDQSMMKGPAELLRAIQDSDRYGEAYVRSFLSGFVPMSVGMAQMARIGDPYSRQTRTIIDAIRNKIPGHLDSMFEQGLFPKRDIWGEEMKAPDALGGRGVTGIYESQISTDPVNVAMLDLGLNPGKVERSITNVDLTDQEYDDFARIAGRMTKMRLDTIVKSGAFQSWPNHVKHDVIQETIKQSRNSARGLMMMKYPHIPRDAVQAKRDRFKD